MTLFAFPLFTRVLSISVSSPHFQRFFHTSLDVILNMYKELGRTKNKNRIIKKKNNKIIGNILFTD